MRRFMYLWTAGLVLAMTSAWAQPQVLEKPQPLILPNAGQWPDEVLGMVNVDAARVWILADGLRFAARLPGESDSVAVWTERFLGAQQARLFVQPESHEVTFLGKNRSARVRGASQARLVGVYPGIDLELRIESGRLKTWWHGRDLSAVRTAFEGAEAQRKLGHPEVLLVRTAAGTAELHAPTAFAADSSAVKPVWVRDGNVWHLSAPGAVHLDPTYVFSSFSGSVSDNFGYTATYDLQGRTWLGGTAFGTQYPTQNGIQANFGGGGVDVALMLFNANGTGIISSTYLGGTGQEQPHSLRVAPNGDLVLMGVTNSVDFPVTPSAYDTSMASVPTGGSLGGGGVVFQSPTDLVLVRLNPTASALTASTYYGRFGYDGLQDVSTPHYGDEARGDLWVDSDGIWIASAVRSRGLATWPLDTSRGGTTDGILAHFSPNLDSLRWATYVGGSGLDGLTSLIPTPTPAGVRLAVVGWTSGMGTLPGNGITTVPNGQAEGYYGLFSLQDGQRLAETYLEPQYCTSYGFLAAQNPAGAYAAVGDSGAVLLSLGLGTLCQGSGPYQGPLAPTPGIWQNPNSTQILTWIAPEGDSVYRTQYVGNGQLNRRISPTALQIDDCGTAYFSGWFGNLNGGLMTNLFTTPNAFQSTTDGKDFYFLALDRQGQPSYASYFGGFGADEHVDGGTSRFDPNGVIHQALCAGCGGTDNLPIFPPSAHSSTNNSPNCNMAGVQIAFELLAASVQLDVNTDTVCAGDSLFLIGTTSRTDQLAVNWGDGTSGIYSPLPLPGHVYIQPGTYNVQLTALDTLCLTQAVQTWTVVVLPGTSVQADVLWTVDPCDPLRTVSFLPGPNFSAEGLVLYASTGAVDSISAPFVWSGTALTTSYSAWLVAYDNVCGRVDSSAFSAEFRPELPQPTASITAPWCLNGQSVRGIGQQGSADRSYWRIPGGTIVEGPNVQWPALLTGSLTAWFVVEDSVCGTRDSVAVNYQILAADVDSLTVPNVYTPNGDAINDEFRLSPSDASALAQCHLRVYSRWGQIVFESNDPSFVWDGRFLGREVVPGVYLYHITWQSQCGSSGSQHGSITLNR